MLTVDEYGRIRRAHRDGMSIREIARTFRHSRRKVRQVLAEPEPTPYVRGRLHCPKLGAFHAVIDQILIDDETAPPKQRHTAMQIFRRLVAEEGYRGAYDAVRRYIGKRRRRARPTFIPLDHEPGQRQEADFGHIYVDFPDGRRQVPVLLLTWGYSNAPFAIAMPTERIESILAGMVAGLEFFGCVGREVWWDNPRTVATAILRGRQRRVHERYAGLANHYCFEAKFCMPASGWEKPRVENRVYDLQRRWATPVPAVNRPGQTRAESRLEEREVRSFENEYVNGLWHMDFHHSSLAVLTPRGEWMHPKLLGVLDDHSRLACHVQWYLSETAEDLVHGLSQAFCKRGLPRALMTDNGAAMIAEETRQGLTRLGVVHETILPYSAYQNGKQEVFWAVVEGRLMAMLEGAGNLTLDFLNQATQAWVEMEYNRTKHSETGEKPLDRFLHGRSVARPGPSSERLGQAFRQDVTRTQRRSDGTITIEGVRFEVPSRFRHLRRLTARYARWNLSRVDLVDERTGALLASIHPLDKAGNAGGRRRVIGPRTDAPSDVDAAAQADASSDDAKDLAPLLRKLLTDYAATGLPPAYLPKSSSSDEVNT